MNRKMLLSALFLLMFQFAWGQIPKTMSYQGILTDPVGNPAPNGNYSMTFRIYEVVSSGAALWTETQTINVTDGIFNAILGKVNPLTLAFDKPYWLGLSVDGGAELAPRTELTAAAYSLSAAAGGGGASWNLAGNSGTNPATNFLGTTDNQALELRTNSQRALRIEPNAESPNLIGGFSGNSVDAGAKGATIGGGGNSGSNNRATGDYGKIGGGQDNIAGDSTGTTKDSTHATIGGGQNNRAHGKHSTIGGGDGNRATNREATVAGGTKNTASGRNATVGGGYNNKASADTATVSGGSFNIAAGTYDAVSGGKSNAANGGYATVSGGKSNVANGAYATVSGGDTNGATAAHATVGGGQSNGAIQNHATVGGGWNNVANDQYSTVSGGRNNNAKGLGSTIGGGTDNKAENTSATVGGGSQNNAKRNGATVGGGSQNKASWEHSTISGGTKNEVFGKVGTIGGGEMNLAGDSTVAPIDTSHATVGGGYSNQATGKFSTIGGGDRNKATGKHSTVGGGDRNEASGVEATVSGGTRNKAIGDGATVGGGVDNEARGKHSAVPGGNKNIAKGGFSFAAGWRAQANHNGAFVWADSTDADFTSTDANQFLIRASGGVGIGANTTPNILTIVQNSATDPIADAWTTYSSRRWKTNIRPIEGAMEKIRRLRGVTYDWKADGKHDIGLIAEEVGEVVPEVVAYEDNGIDARSVDYARLVALLIEAVKEQQKEIEELKGAVKALSAGIQRQESKSVTAAHK